MQPHGAIVATPIVTDKEIGSSLGVCPSVRIYMQDFLGTGRVANNKITRIVIDYYLIMLLYRVGNTC